MSTSADLPENPDAISVPAGGPCCGSCPSCPDYDGDLEDVTLAAQACTPGEACEACQ